MLKITLKVKNIFSDEREQAVTIGKDGKRITLAYGLNGTGKTTLSTFLYKKFVKREDVSQGTYADCEAEGFEDELCVRVFNRKFIEDYFYSSPTQPGIFNMSEGARDVGEAIDRLQGERVKHDKELVSKGEEIANLQREQGTLEEKFEDRAWDLTVAARKEFEEVDDKDYLTGMKRDKTKFLKKIENTAMSPLTPIGAEYLKKEFNALTFGSILSKTTLFAFDAINSIEANPIWGEAIKGKENSPYADIINRLENTDWVKRGVDKYLTEGEEVQPCPFCQQDMAHQIIKGLKGHFDEQYEKKINALESLIATYKEEKRKLSQLLVRDTEYSGNEAIEPQWNEYSTSINNILDAMEDNLVQMERKLSAPSVTVSIDFSNGVQKQYENKRFGLNLSIDSFNGRIKNAESEKKKIGGKLWSLMKWQCDADLIFRKYGESLQEAARKITAAEQERVALKEAVAKISADIIVLEKMRQGTAEAVDAINKGLRGLGILNFEMVMEDDLYAIRRIPGGDANGIYDTLSEGEKTIICFLYFMELCKGKSSAEEQTAKKVVVIDDPISSLSHQFALNVSQMIVEHVRAGKAENSGVKALILTHNLYFFHELKRSFAPRKDKVKERIVMYRFFRKGKDDNNRLIHIDSMEDGEIVSEYQSYWATIQDEDHPACVANAMRCILEYFFGFMLNLNSLDGVLGRIKINGDAYTNAFIRYMQKGSHLNAEILDIEAEMDVEQWMKQFKRVFEENNHLDHFDAMMRNRKSKSASGE